MAFELKEIASWALIAGGSEGVGACFARRLASQGINLVLVARKPEPLEALATELRAGGVEVRTLCADLTAPDTLDRVRAITGDLEIGLMIHNAGSISKFGDFVDSPLERAEGTIQINVLSQVHFAHHFGGLMRRRGKGAIVLMGSMAGNAGCAKTAAYAAAKAFSQTLAEGLWMELRPHGVHVLGLVIGGTRTPALIRNIGDGHPGLAEPDDVAREGLEHLLDGPIWVASGNGGAAKYIRNLPRGEAVEMMSKGTATMIDAA